MELKRAGTQPSIKGPAEWFTGSVRIDPLSNPPAPARHSCAAVAVDLHRILTYRGCGQDSVQINSLAFVTDFSIRKEVAAGQLVGIRLDHPLTENQYARVLVKEKRPLPRAAQEVINAINRHLADLSTERAHSDTLDATGI